MCMAMMQRKGVENPPGRTRWRAHGGFGSDVHADAGSPESFGAIDSYESSSGAGTEAAIFRWHLLRPSSSRFPLAFCLFLWLFLPASKYRANSTQKTTPAPKLVASEDVCLNLCLGRPSVRPAAMPTAGTSMADLTVSSSYYLAMRYG